MIVCGHRGTCSKWRCKFVDEMPLQACIQMEKHWILPEFPPWWTGKHQTEFSRSHYCAISARALEPVVSMAHYRSLWCANSEEVAWCSTEWPCGTWCSGRWPLWSFFPVCEHLINGCYRFQACLLHSCHCRTRDDDIGTPWSEMVYYCTYLHSKNSRR